MKMEAQLANLTALVQTAVIRDQPPGGGSRPGSARSESSVTSDTSAKSSKWMFLLFIHGLMQDCNISIANALEIPQSCTKPSITFLIYDHFT